MINQVTIMGRLTADPVKRGEHFVTFDVALNYRSRNPQTGATTEYVDFVACKAFRGQADKLIERAKKGQMITITGHLNQERWETDGQKRARLVVVTDRSVLHSVAGAPTGTSQPANTKADSEAEAAAVAAATSSATDNNPYDGDEMVG